MNIEEERKAFEAMIDDHPMYSRNDDLKGLFPVWLAAKAHAVEMAKPVASVRFRKDRHQWAVYFPTSLTAAAYDFPHKEDAVQWAKNNGYRVIE